MSWAGDIFTKLSQLCDLSYVFGCPTFLIPIHFLSQVLQPSCWFGSYPTSFQYISFLLMVARANARSLCTGMMVPGATHSTLVTSLQPHLVKLAATVVTLGLVPVLMQDSAFHQLVSSGFLASGCLYFIFQSKRTLFSDSITFLFLSLLLFRNGLRQYEESIPMKQAKIALKSIPVILQGLTRWTRDYLDSRWVSFPPG